MAQKRTIDLYRVDVSGGLDFEHLLAEVNILHPFKTRITQ